MGARTNPDALLMFSGVGRSQRVPSVPGTILRYHFDHSHWYNVWFDKLTILSEVEGLTTSPERSRRARPGFFCPSSRPESRQRRDEGRAGDLARYRMFRAETGES